MASMEGTATRPALGTLPGAQARPADPNGQTDKGPKRGPRTESERVDAGLTVVNSVIDTLRAGIKEVDACKVPGVDLRYNLALKLGALMAETGLRIPRGAKA